MAITRWVSEDEANPQSLRGIRGAEDSGVLAIDTWLFMRRFADRLWIRSLRTAGDDVIDPADVLFFEFVELCFPEGAAREDAAVQADAAESAGVGRATIERLFSG